MGLAGSLGLLLVCAAADGGAEPPAEAPTPAAALVSRTLEREYVEQLLEDGRHVRFGTADRGPVNVWWPSFYRAEKASIVVYLHGFFSTTDSAFFEHRLPTQFRDSGRNAVFIVPEAPSWRTDPVYWADLEALLASVFERTRLKRAAGPVMVLAHSGAYRTTIEWLAHPNLKQVVLLDALYAGDRDFRRWLEASGEQADPAPTGRPAPGKQLVLVGFETAQRTDWFLKAYPGALKLDDVPYLYDRLPGPSTAPVIYFGSDRFDHMALVTDGRVLPYLLRALP